MLAYAQTQSQARWGRSALKSAQRAIAMCRGLDPESSDHTLLLARSLRTTATLLLGRGKPGEALPLAEEAVALSRLAGGGHLIVALTCLAGVLEELRRYSDAAAAWAEVSTIAPPEEDADD
ncbi:hypothetical protein HII36_01605 [Nonomuraea sp. NN258]|uniref:hypothetical protein n=1 Tax=Nonomuraea antri TaxID=2730852 RepID=UPI001568FE29|nr:hypothetical protein [Nonomuraea antri]NRQ30542.1 hypothetical protein [Nonomuraea antri]